MALSTLRWMLEKRSLTSTAMGAPLGQDFHFCNSPKPECDMLHLLLPGAHLSQFILSHSRPV